KGNVEKGDRVFIFMPRTPELYFALFGILKIGAIVGPLFEAFMEKAVGDRLENSEASVIVTTNNLLPRDRKSTRLNSSHVSTSYAVFCLKKKKREAKKELGDARQKN